MSTYLVRTIDTLRLVGIFVAKNSKALFHLIDDELDPCSCEYLALKDEEGIHLDALFTANMVDDGTGESDVVHVGIESVSDPEEPRLTDSLARRLDKGRSWTAFTTKNFLEAFNIPEASLRESMLKGPVVTAEGMQ